MEKRPPPEDHLEFDRGSDVVTACIKKLADELERRLCAENLSLDAFDVIEEDDEVVVDKRTTHTVVLAHVANERVEDVFCC